MNDFIATSVAAIDDQEKEREREREREKIGRVRGEIIRQVREEEEEEEEGEKKTSQWRSFPTSVIGDLKLVIGSPRSLREEGSGREDRFTARTVPYFAKLSSLRPRSTPFTRRSDHLVLHSRGECASSRGPRLTRGTSRERRNRVEDVVCACLRFLDRNVHCWRFSTD